MEYEIHRKETRGSADHGWLHVNHSFSFASYYNPKRMGFGVLRVFNDDIIDPTYGFDTHPHKDMEIITIPLSGELSHKDNTGGEGVIHQGEVQVMSAGTGVFHSEYNRHTDKPANVLQTWVYPNAKNLEPRYDQKAYDKSGRKNKFQLIVSPDGRDDSLWVNQNTFYNMADLDLGTALDYKFNSKDSGVYLFVIEGEVEIAGEVLNKRDAIAISSREDFKIKGNLDSQIILLEVPLSA